MDFQWSNKISIFAIGSASFASAAIRRVMFAVERLARKPLPRDELMSKLITGFEPSSIHFKQFLTKFFTKFENMTMLQKSQFFVLSFWLQFTTAMIFRLCICRCLQKFKIHIPRSFYCLSIHLVSKFIWIIQHANYIIRIHHANLQLHTVFH